MAFRIIFFFLLFFGHTILRANPWNVIVFYDATSNRLEVNVYPQIEKGKEKQISFSSSIIDQNHKDSIYVVDRISIDDKQAKSTLVQNPFVISQTTFSFSYLIDLSRNKNIPTSALIDYKPLILVNWDEVLFEAADSTELNIEFNYFEKSTNLGTKTLASWKKELSKIANVKPLATINNVSLYSNEVKSKAIDELKELLTSFHHLEAGHAKSLFVIFGQEGLSSSGQALDHQALVYFDQNTEIKLEQQDLDLLVIHELSHWLNPYKIHPETEDNWRDKNWLSEATPEYLALKFLLKTGRMTEEEFLAKFEEKLRLASKFNGQSLNDLSYLVYSDASVYQAFYSKGCVALFLLDIQLYAATKGKLNIAAILFNNFPELDDESQLKVHQILNQLENELVMSKENFALNKYLPLLGLLYEKQIVLPMKPGDDTATIKKENISFNKMASAEQKDAWLGFIKH